MFSQAKMNSAAIRSAMLRPGVALGPYPQRHDMRDSMLDRLAAVLTGFVRQQAQFLGLHDARFLRAVNARAEGLAAMTEFELRLHIRTLRGRLYSEGLTGPNVVAAFATVREVAQRQLKLRHYDVQLLGGRTMLRGMVAEMETGEGKTLTATLPACTAALAGIPVHIVTVNDFLVDRDAAWMGPVYTMLGLTVGTVTEGMKHDERRSAYACDVVYCTNKQLTFDYLKDRLTMGQNADRLQLRIEGLYLDRPRSSRVMMRGLCFAIVDEADSVLVDEARTPLIISSQGDSTQEESSYREAIAVARKLDSTRDFVIRTRARQIDLTDFGRARVDSLTKSHGGVWRGKKRREELVQQALAALHLYQLDKHYLLRDGKVQIIDEFTGRVMEDRSWERGLHQMVEAKEGYTLSGRHETLARMSYQRFFRRYLLLAGMTGTAREVAGELWSVYRLNVVRVPTHRPLARTKQPDRLYVTADAKWRAILSRVRELHRRGCPVLVGTRSVAASEHISGLLRQQGLQHRVLNARQDGEEAQIIAQAGQLGRITVATNMAGRGTDIRLADGVAELGGLHVVATERHEARRIDRQLYGRAARQGAPGSSETFLSLQDELLTDFYGQRLPGLAGRLFSGDKPVPGVLARPLVWVAQRAAERHHGSTRRDLLRADEKMGDMLAYSGRAE